MPVTGLSSPSTSTARVADAQATSPTLRQGSRGEAVRQLQQQLVDRGASISVDGAFGPNTRAAVVAFQRENGLSPDGVVGPLTHAALAGPVSPASPTAPRAPSAPQDGVDGTSTTPAPNSGLTPSAQDRVPGMSGADFLNQANLDASRRPSGSAPTLPPAGTVQTQGGPVRIREGSDAAATLRAQSPAHARLVDDMRAQGFFPVRMGDGSHVFMSNPTYAADTTGRGTSSREARAYADSHGLRLPTRAEGDAFRAQANVVVQFEPGPTPGTAGARTAAQQQERINARLAAAGITDPSSVMVAGATKIWAQEPGQRPGLNGATRNVQTGQAWQGYSTVHGPDYEDYSQAAQFVHSTRIAADGSIER